MLFVTFGTMFFNDVIGLGEVKERLVQTVASGRVSHAQLFLGSEGSGNLALAIAYAQFLSCGNRQEKDSCGTCPSCVKYQKLAHPDLHFVYPVATTKEVTSKPVSGDFISQWREAVLENPYMSLFDWLGNLGIENKQGNINAEESGEILKKLSLTTYESEYKVMIIWMAEKMNHFAANKLLKILEEPPEKTLFLLVVQEHDQLLNTIISRTQLVKIHKIPDEELKAALVEKHQLSAEQATMIAHLADGNYNAALHLMNDSENEKVNFSFFQSWMRSCYARKAVELTAWVDSISAIGREKQKNFLAYSLHMVRESLMMNLGANSLVKLGGNELEFVTRFSKFIHPNNGSELTEQLNKGISDIERNANPKILFLDLSFKVMELLAVPA